MSVSCRYCRGQGQLRESGGVCIWDGRGEFVFAKEVVEEVVWKRSFAVDAHVKVAHNNELGMVRRLGEVRNGFVKVVD